MKASSKVACGSSSNQLASFKSTKSINDVLIMFSTAWVSTTGVVGCNVCKRETRIRCHCEQGIASCIYENVATTCCWTLLAAVVGQKEISAVFFLAGMAGPV